MKYAIFFHKKMSSAKISHMADAIQTHKKQVPDTSFLWMGVALPQSITEPSDPDFDLPEIQAHQLAEQNLIHTHADQGATSSSEIASGRDVNAQNLSTSFAASSPVDAHIGTQGRLVVWGDSIANGLAGHLNQSQGVLNLGRDGAGLIGGPQTRALDGIQAGDTVIISIGTNDVASLMSGGASAWQRFEARLNESIEAIRAQGGTPVLLDVRNVTGAYTGGAAAWRQEGFVGNWNQTADTLNRFFDGYADQHGISFVQTNGSVDISNDRLHPSARGFDQIAHHFAPAP